jgi:hypothetical protein
MGYYFYANKCSYFFYKLQVGNVVTEDLKTTAVYSEQIAKRVNISKVDSAKYNTFKKECEVIMNDFANEATGNGPTHQIGIHKHALKHINTLNQKLNVYGNYKIERPSEVSGNLQKVNEQISLTRRRLMEQYVKIEDEQLRVTKTAAYQAQDDLNKIQIMQKHINDLIQIGVISHASSEPIIKQAGGVLTLAYSNIKTSDKYVYFNNNTADEKLYTADNIETRLSRFLHPYKVLGDFFVGRIPFIFIFWIILSILLDVIGFISFDNAFKKEDF